jgi:hypothetical protein
LKHSAPLAALLLTAGLLGTLVAASPAPASIRSGEKLFMGRGTPRPGSPAHQLKLERLFAERARATSFAAGAVKGGGPVLDAWQTDGMLACTSPTGQIFPVVTTDGANGAIVAWLDFRDGSVDVYANRLDSNGDYAPGWTGAGTAVAVRDSVVIEVQIDTDGAGGAFVGFTEFFLTGFNYQDVYIQRVLGTGAIAGGWPAGGRKLNVGEISGFAIAADGTGGVFAGWLDENEQAWLLRLDNAGNPVSGWPAAGIPVGPALAADVNFTPDGSGGFYGVWSNADSVYATRYAANGTVASGWSAAGTPIAYGGFFTDGLALTRLTSGDVMVSWADFRSLTDLDLYAVRLAASGGFAAGWAANGVQVCGATGSLGGSAAVSDGAGGAVIIWEDFRDMNGTGLYSQRITGAGAIASGWTVDGVSMCAVSTTKFVEAFVGDGAGGIFAAWVDDPLPADGNDVFAQFIQGSGARPSAYPAAGLGVCTAAEDQYDVSIATDGAGGAILAWDDNRSFVIPTQVFLARIRNDGTAATASLANAVAEPGLVRLLWFSPDGASFAATLERDTDGRGFAALAELRADATGHVRYEDHDVLPGATYRYRLVVHEAGSRTILGEVTLRIPESLALALEPARPNPTSGPLTLAFVLPSTARATLELLDVTGRRVLQQELNGAAGRQVLRLDESLAPGVYVARLAQSGKAVTSRVVVTE